MTTSRREQLIATRPTADAFVRAMRALPPSIVGMEAAIGELAISPIKSLGMLKQHMLRVSRYGLTTPDALIPDRFFMLALREQGEVKGVPYRCKRFSGRNFPGLSAAVPFYESGGLSFRCKGMPDLPLSPKDFDRRRDDGEPIKVRFYEEDPEVFDALLEPEDGVITWWVRLFLETKKWKGDPRSVVVPRQPPVIDRSVEERHRCGVEGACTMFSDGGQILVVSRSTVDLMNGLRRAADPAEIAIDIDVFRANVVLEELPPGAEHLMASGEIGDDGVLMGCGGDCVRCAVVGKKALAWLAENWAARPDKRNSTVMGVNAVVMPGGEGKIIMKGQTFRVMSEK